MITPFIPKEHPDLPDFYGIEVEYTNGKSKTFEVVSHKIVDRSIFNGNQLMPLALPYYELLLKDDTFVQIPMSSVQSFHLDKSWSKILSLKEKS